MQVTTASSWRHSKRYIVVAMVFVGYMIFFAVHANVGMAVVEMTSPKTSPGPNGTSIITDGPEYSWDSVQKALVISSLSYGRMLSPIGVTFAARIGGSTLYLWGIVCVAVITYCTPYLLYLHFYSFLLGNALTGFCEGMAYASVIEIWSRWAPPNERAKMASIGDMGVYAGLMSSFMVSGWILYEMGWATLFHITGIATLFWAGIWYVLVKNDPADAEWITDDEKKYIKEQMKTVVDDQKKLVYPWKDLLTCVPFWLACMVKFAYGVGFAFMMMNLPQYIKDMNDIDIKKIGYISTIPQICALIAMPFAGYIFDYMRSNEILSLTNVHKLYACIGLISGVVTFLVAGLWPNFIASVVCLSLFQVCVSCTVLENQIVMLDLAPRYAAFMVSIASSCYTVALILTPMIVGYTVTSHSRSQWNICFMIFGILFVSTSLICLKFLKVKLQRWANYSPDESNEQKT